MAARRCCSRARTSCSRSRCCSAWWPPGTCPANAARQIQVEGRVAWAQQVQATGVLGQAMSEANWGELEELVARADADRYVAALFVSPARRRGLIALYAFNYEVARIREIVHEPM